MQTDKGEICDLYDDFEPNDISRVKYIGEKDQNFHLDREIEKIKAKNILKYAERVERGVDIFTEELLGLGDLCATRGLGSYPLQVAISMLSDSDKKLYKSEIIKGGYYEV